MQLADIREQYAAQLRPSQERIPPLPRREEVSLEMQFRSDRSNVDAGCAGGRRWLRHLASQHHHEAIYTGIQGKQPPQKRGAPRVAVRRDETAIDFLHPEPRTVNAGLNQATDISELGAQGSLQDDEPREQVMR